LPILPRVSTPPFLHPPDGTQRATLKTTRGELAAWVLEPPGVPLGTAVLIPGFTGSKEDFVAVLAPLAADGWRVVTYDQRGQHDTPGTSEPYTREFFAADAAAVVRTTAATGAVHLLGHSFGGLVAQQLVLDEPDLVTTLTLLCSGPGALPDEDAPALRLLAEALATDSVDRVWEAKLAWDLEHGWVGPSDEAVLAFLRHRFLANDPASLVAMARLLIEASDQVDELAKVAPPTLVVYGEDDDAWPLAMQDDMAIRLGARLEVLPRAAHSPAAETPAATAALLSSFWGERVAA
jgi:pimeloyl-ACP methyl ester carboxylesterase